MQSAKMVYYRLLIFALMSRLAVEAADNKPFPVVCLLPKPDEKCVKPEEILASDYCDHSRVVTRQVLDQANDQVKTPNAGKEEPVVECLGYPPNSQGYPNIIPPGSSVNDGCPLANFNWDGAPFQGNLMTCAAFPCQKRNRIWCDLYIEDPAKAEACELPPLCDSDGVVDRKAYLYPHFEGDATHFIVVNKTYCEKLCTPEKNDGVGCRRIPTCRDEKHKNQSLTHLFDKDIPKDHLDYDPFYVLSTCLPWCSKEESLNPKLKRKQPCNPRPIFKNGAGPNPFFANEYDAIEQADGKKGSGSNVVYAGILSILVLCAIVIGFAIGGLFMWKKKKMAKQAVLDSEKSSGPSVLVRNNSSVMPTQASVTAIVTSSATPSAPKKKLTAEEYVAQVKQHMKNKTDKSLESESSDRD
ncbi:unnamed protein product, partial [Mesorhabditis spiculigera]